MFIKMQLLLFLIGSLSFHVLAEEASTVSLDDEAPTTDSRDSDVSEFPTFPVTTESSSLEDPVTTDSVLSTSDDAENSTDPSLPESDDGLETATLVGIIFGVIAAIAVATGIIILVVKKMGRYSP
ncbi:podoplanin-like [Lacerta agilis]|uniref:podoplanin-like n=1 Tax=Lacerta agilis TaxID=80427 RepID=UPI00141A53B4|nr:podoplanin-like [Lacerta agilis]